MNPTCTLHPGPWPLARYRFEARMQAPLRLPDYAGSLLRGAFGAALRRTACMTQLPQCSTCPLYRSCPYPAVFETPPRQTPLAQQFSQVPNPYVVEPPPLSTRQVAEGEVLQFHMVLMGDETLRQLPLIVHAWQRALRHGLGQQRAQATLERVAWVNTETGYDQDVFDPQTQQTLTHKPGLTITEPPQSGGVTLNIHTPMRLQSQGRPLGPQQLEPRTLLTTLARRISLVLHLHGGLPGLPSIDTLMAALPQLRESARQLRWHDWVRYSARQKQEMALGGVLGHWSLEGDIAPLWPWLFLGQHIHIGKNASLGMGHYTLTPAP
jgi:hypothetical protein